MKVYIAGPITGNPDYLVHFHRAAEEFKNKGHIVLNPTILPAGLEWEEYMIITLRMVGVSDKILMLKGWEKSRGACEEHDLAKHLGIKIEYE